MWDRSSGGCYALGGGEISPWVSHGIEVACEGGVGKGEKRVTGGERG